MIKRLTGYLLLGLSVLLLLIFYNYSQAQTRLRQASQTQFNIELTEFPAEISIGESKRFALKVTAPRSFSTTQTGIYYSYDSTPSALMKGDSPAAAGYQSFTPDYFAGSFRLPDTFDLNLSFDRRGTVYFRAYAKIDQDHLWTEEKRIVVK